MSAIGSSIPLILALADLSETRSLLGAIHAADAASGKTFAAAFIGPAPDKDPGSAISGDSYEATRAPLHPSPTYEARRVIHPTPFYAPRPVLHPEPRVEPRVEPSPSDDVAPPEGERSHRRWPDPPWAMLPPIVRPLPNARVKKVVEMLDRSLVARSLDLFI